MGPWAIRHLTIKIEQWRRVIAEKYDPFGKAITASRVSYYALLHDIIFQECYKNELLIPLS